MGYDKEIEAIAIAHHWICSPHPMSSTPRIACMAQAVRYMLVAHVGLPHQAPLAQVQR
jgi:hypothetical protein